MFEGIGVPVKLEKTDLSRIDTTLEAHRQREIESDLRNAALKATLRRHDRIALTERRRRNLINDLSFGSGCRCCYDPNSDGGEYSALIDLRAKQQQIENDDSQEGGLEQNDANDNSDSDSDDDSEFDYLLDEDIGGIENNSVLMAHQQERKEDLQLSVMIHESARQHGFGVHRQFHPSRVLHAAGLGMDSVRRNRAASIPPAAVIHLHDPESMMCAYLDLFLEKLGETYRGTKFVRANGRSTLSMNKTLATEVLPKLNVDSGIPALIAVKDGVVAAISELSALGNQQNGTIENGAVEFFLMQANVLLINVPLEFEDYCRIRPEEDALIENMMREKMKLESMA